MKLPPGEAERRKKLRNDASSERRRQTKAAYKAIHGCNPPTPERRKEQMKQYARRKREKEKAMRPPKKPKPVKPLRAPKPPKPTKMVKPVKPKIMPAARKPKTQARVFKTRDTTQGKVKVRIDHRTEVYITPGQDIDQVKARYLNRRL